MVAVVAPPPPSGFQGAVAVVRSPPPGRFRGAVAVDQGAVAVDPPAPSPPRGYWGGGGSFLGRDGVELVRGPRSGCGIGAGRGLGWRADTHRSPARVWPAPHAGLQRSSSKRSKPDAHVHCDPCSVKSPGQRGAAAKFTHTNPGNCDAADSGAPEPDLRMAAAMVSRANESADVANRPKQ